MITRSPSLHEVEELRRLAVGFDDLDISRGALAEPRRDDATGRIVAAIEMADADDQGRRHRPAPHPRSMRRSRKCVAQEMQGS